MPNWVSIVGWIVALSVTVFTLLVLWKQTKAATENVLATRTLANLERPWVTIHPDMPTHWPFDRHTPNPPFGFEIRWKEANLRQKPRVCYQILR
jgi:hypothetical protein